MEIFDGHRALFRPLVTPAVAIGNFDGVHVGHQRLLQEAVSAAARLGGDAVVYTFDPHPAQVLAPDLAPPLITTRQRKLELFAEAGVDICVLEPFTPELAAWSPDDFVDQVLVKSLRAAEVIVGYDFTYGRKRAGDVEALTRAGIERGFVTCVIPPVSVDGVVASSTKVRELVLEGNMKGARLLLGRDFEIEGVVVKGEGRGKSIGVPTANIESATQLIPAHGVYAVRARVLDEPGGAVIDGVANLGVKPTFTDADELTLEVHLFDFDGDLYGRPLRVQLVQRLRGEKRFAGVDQLVEQIRADAARAREILAG